MFLDLIFKGKVEPQPVRELIAVGTRMVTLHLVRHPRARRYLLRLLPDGSARVTIPRGGSAKEARSFVERQTQWLENQLQQLRDKPAQPADWVEGGQIFFRGELTTLHRQDSEHIQLGTELIKCGGTAHLRAAVQRQLQQLAFRELPPRVFTLSHQHAVVVNRVTVRSQKTRWGSCSRHGTISLNWRLIQLPTFVSDYIILHELMHRRQLNHSAKFWREVAAVCPAYETAERWLKKQAGILR